MKYIFDLDGTLLEDNGGNYADSKPIRRNIELVKELYDSGNTIVIQTGRSKHWYKFTEEQLKYHKILFHVLSVGEKIHGDVYIDDKAINAKDFFK